MIWEEPKCDHFNARNQPVMELYQPDTPPKELTEAEKNFAKIPKELHGHLSEFYYMSNGEKCWFLAQPELRSQWREDINFSVTYLQKTFSKEQCRERLRTLFRRQGIPEDQFDYGPYTEKEVLVTTEFDPVLRDACLAVIADNPAKVAEFKAGNPKMLNWLLGQVMKRGKFEAKLVSECLKHYI